MVEARAACVRKKRSKSRACSVSAMPIPRSSTANEAPVASTDVDTTIGAGAGEYFVALSTRIAINRSSCAGRPRTGAAVTRVDTRPSSGHCRATTLVTSVPRSTASNGASSTPASARAIVRRSDTSALRRVECARTSVRAASYSCTERARRSASSAVVRISETGVRSSCDASDVKLAISETPACSRSSMPLKVAASRCSSSLVSPTSSRWSRCPTSIDAAARVRASIGRSARALTK